MQRLEKVYRDERSSLLGFIRSRTGSLEEAEDLLQDVFFQAIRAASVTDPIENVVGWLYTIARNKIIDRYRRKKDTVSLQQEREDVTLEDLLDDSGIDIEKEMIRRAVMDALIEALQSGRLFAAGLDVFNNEPHIDPRYRALENTFLLPHIVLIFFNVTDLFDKPGPESCFIINKFNTDIIKLFFFQAPDNPSDCFELGVNGRYFYEQNGTGRDSFLGSKTDPTNTDVL